MATIDQYAAAFPALSDEDFIAAGFSPDEVYSYRINQQAQSETARAGDFASMQEQRRARGQALAAQYPDYFTQGLETEPLYGIDQRMSDIKAGAELTQDPNFARRQFARFATDLGLPLSLTESALGLAEITPYGSFASGFDVAASIPHTAEYLREGEYGRAALSGAGGVLSALDVIGASLPITVPAARAVSKIDTGKLAADIVGTGRSLADMDIEFLRGRGNPAMSQPAGAQVTGRPPLTFDDVERAMAQGVGADVVGDQSFDVTRKDASGIFGQGTERVRYTDPASGGTMEVVVRPDGSASVLELEVPEEFRGQGIGQSLQDKVMQDFPMMGGQVSSKAAATTAYRLGRRPPNNPDATLEDVFAEIDEMSSVNMVSPQMQSRFGGASAPDIPEAPALPDPRNNAEAAAKEVLELRAAGRANEVTEEMMAAADDQYMYFNTPLPMDEASRMARARELGFDTGVPLYHGTDKDFSAFDPRRFGEKDPGWYGRGVTSDTDPEVAAGYADYNEPEMGQQIIPNFAKGRYIEWPEGQLPFGNPRASIAGTRDMQALGYSGSRMTNDRDLYGDAPDVQSEYVTFDPSNIRSRFARFDPEFRNLRNLSAGVGGAAVLTALADDAEAGTPEQQISELVREAGFDGAAQILGVSPLDIEEAISIAVPQGQWDQLVVGQ